MEAEKKSKMKTEGKFHLIFIMPTGIWWAKPQKAQEGFTEQL